jgi:hypothetical protein
MALNAFPAHLMQDYRYLYYERSHSQFLARIMEEFRMRESMQGDEVLACWAILADGRSRFYLFTELTWDAFLYILSFPLPQFGIQPYSVDIVVDIRTHGFSTPVDLHLARKAWGLISATGHPLTRCFEEPRALRESGIMLDALDAISLGKMGMFLYFCAHEMSIAWGVHFPSFHHG